MKYWFVHDPSDTYFLEDRNYVDERGDTIFLNYDESVSENEIEKLHRRDILKARFVDGEVTKPKINNWTDILSKVRNIYDSWNLKVKHATEEYINLPYAPEPDDLLHFIFSKRKSLFLLSELIDVFGNQRRETIENSVTWLLDKQILLGYPYQNEDEDILPEWNYSETDKFCINVNYNGE